MIQPEKLSMVISFSYILTYLSIRVKRISYFLLTIVTICISMTFGPETKYQLMLFDKYIKWIDSKTLLGYVYLANLILIVAVFVYIYIEDKKSESQNIRDDFMVIYQPKLGNMIFWTSLVILNIAVFWRFG